MRRMNFINLIVGCTLVLFLLSGCFGKVDKTVTNYYILDYQSSGEKAELHRPNNTGKILEVLDTSLSKTYDRNQIVVKKNFYSVQYLQNDVWATKLRDAIPNIVVQRLRAYNLFEQISRNEVLDKNPNYFLETNVLNIEKIDGVEPKAYLRMEFVMRDSSNQAIVLAHRNERYMDLNDLSMVYLVQAFNEMIMEETNLFAAKCNLYFSGIKISDSAPNAPKSQVERYVLESMAQSAAVVTYGELSVKTKTFTDEQIRYTIEGLDSLNTVISIDEQYMNDVVPMVPGRYRVTVGEEREIAIPVEIQPKQRSVLIPQWGELQVVILDESKTRVRMGYDIWVKDTSGLGYKNYSGGMVSMGDDEIGAMDKLWLLPPGHYMVKLGGGSWSDMRNFATVPLQEGDRKTLTIIVDPTAETNVFVGAGVFADDDLGLGSKRIHKGAIHGNVSVSSNNNVDKSKPSMSFNAAAQFENNLDIHQKIRPFHFTSRSLYKLGLNITNDTDFRFNLDDYSLKSVLLLYPFEKKAFLKNFAFYGRADQNTHFFDETTFFTMNKDYILLDNEGTQVSYKTDQPSMTSKKAFYPLRLKEGTGLTYRINFGSNSWMSLRGGYGWQQDYNNNSYIFVSEVPATATMPKHDVYKEDVDLFSKGIESTIILSANNIFKFFSLNSTLDVLFPMNAAESNYRLDNDNSLNIRLYRNISIDVNVNIKYDKVKKPWVVYDGSSFLRVSLFY
ncbi:hypothetical protein MASR2M64_18640 [Candidatus Cloacimonadota bacterium]|nr:ABC-type transport auxiliary lipoprotein family protein [Candidatus Cloacimonadota bacterium]